MKKYYTIRIYKTYDSDLYSFIRYNRVNMKKIIVDVLKAYGSGRYFILNTEDYSSAVIYDDRRSYTYQVIFDTENDVSILSILDKIKPGYRNAFIKNIVRFYMVSPLNINFLLDTNDFDFFKASFRIFLSMHSQKKDEMFIGIPDKDEISNVSKEGHLDLGTSEFWDSMETIDVNPKECITEDEKNRYLELIDEASDTGNDDLTNLFTYLIS